MRKYQTTIINLTPTLQYFRHLGSNPWFCDCRLSWLTKYIRSKSVEASGASCQGPNRWINWCFEGNATSIWICSDCVVWHLRVFLETDWNVIVLIDILMERETKLAASPHSMIRWAQSEIICCEWFLTVYDEFASFYRSATFILWYLSFFR